jgi:Ca2+-binding EF-hand superfamily protein
MSTTTHDRLERRFELWDTNGDGRIERSDWEAEAQRILKSFGTDQDTPRGRAVMSSYMHMWDYLASQAGNSTKSLTLEQFKKVSHDHIINPGDVGFSNVLRPTIRAIADLCDHDGDGRVSFDGFKSWLKAVGADQSKAKETFQRLDENGDGHLTVDELVHAVRDYHAGTLDVSLLGD